MPFELSLFLIALVWIALRAWWGWQSGATVELRQVLTSLFATLVALRYWFSLTIALSHLVTLDPRYLAAGVFIALFIASWGIAAFVINFKGEVYQSVFANPLNQVLGALAGVLSGGLMAGSFLMLTAIALPGNVESFDPANFPARLDQFPKGVFQAIEQSIAHVSPFSPAHTPFAELTSSSGNADQPPALIWK